ncbi:hypothetical protein QWZ06_18430 [Chryseobacterium tructae]|uniref:Uncharacterized protein n=1 Tax=Chryseobacterium tructae TaxID=1037380 RepID=A0ABV7Y0T2_9FLAO|nr:hypothetical protein [Chryseobacterium tructae]MDN3694112.1 hypothetical protein [Chryseobacterium tructae]
MKKVSICLFILLVTITSCKDEKSPLIIKENKSATKKYNLPNDEFREKILSKIKHENDKKKLEKLLQDLDKKNLSFCNFVKNEFKIDDSCYSAALKRYPAPEMQKEFMKVHNDIYEIAQKKYLQQIGITDKDANFLTVVYSFDQNVQKLCGKY